jgi:hypothetical protein
MRLVENKVFEVRRFIEPSTNLSDNVWLRETMANIRPKKDFLLVSLFASFCSTCRNGKIIDRLTEAYESYSAGIEIIAILNSRYNNEDDVAALKSQSRIPFPIMLSDNMLGQRWNDFIDEFNEDLLDGILILSRYNGEIIDVLDSSCGCDEAFFASLEAKIQSRSQGGERF